MSDQRHVITLTRTFPVYACSVTWFWLVLCIRLNIVLNFIFDCWKFLHNRLYHMVLNTLDLQYGWLLYFYCLLLHSSIHEEWIDLNICHMYNIQRSSKCVFEIVNLTLRIHLAMSRPFITIYDTFDIWSMCHVPYIASSVMKVLYMALSCPTYSITCHIIYISI